MIVAPTTNQSFKFESRETNATSFEVTYIREGANDSNNVTLSGSYQNGQVQINTNLNLKENTYYLFIVTESGSELCRHKVFVTDQQVDSYKITTNTYSSANSFEDDYIVI
jgi:hypothetical protein